MKPQLLESASEDLANITLDEDNRALDDFFNSDDEADDKEIIRDSKAGESAKLWTFFLENFHSCEFTVGFKMYYIKF